MIDELNEYLEKDMLEDRWYYDVIFTCEDIINGFMDEDWSELQTVIPKKDARWKRRLEECLEDIDDPNIFKCRKLLDSDRKTEQ